MFATSASLSTLYCCTTRITAFSCKVRYIPGIKMHAMYVLQRSRYGEGTAHSDDLTMEGDSQARMYVLQ